MMVGLGETLQVMLDEAESFRVLDGMLVLALQIAYHLLKTTCLLHNQFVLGKLSSLDLTVLTLLNDQIVLQLEDSYDLFLELHFIMAVIN